MEQMFGKQVNKNVEHSYKVYSDLIFVQKYKTRI